MPLLTGLTYWTHPMQNANNEVEMMISLCTQLGVSLAPHRNAARRMILHIAQHQLYDRAAGET